MKKVAPLILAAVLLISAHANAATTHVFKTGDTLWELAAKHYGDPTLYPVLLQVNNISNPRTIPNGKVIIIPDKADMKIIANESDPAKRQELIAQANNGKALDPVENKQTKPARPDQVSRDGEVDPDEISFTNILQGPKVSADKLIRTNTP